jgi:succinyl-CoA synthetase beta subunit
MKKTTRAGLADERLAEGVYLNLRAGIYQCQLVADGVVRAKERLLIQR